MQAKPLSIVALIAVAVVVPAFADWPQYRGPAGRGRVEAGLPAGDGALELRPDWIRDIGSGYSGVAIDGGRLVVVFAAGEHDVVAAYDSSSGEEAWRYQLEPTYTGHDGSHDGPIATPLIHEGTVVALGAWGRLAAIDLASGQELWAQHLVEDLELTKPWYGFGSSPLAVDGNVIVGGAGDEGTLAAFDLETGALRWRAGTDAINYQSPTVVELAGKRQVVIGGQKTVFAVEPSSGEMLWSYEHGGGGGRGAASMTVLPIGGDRLFVDHDDRLSALLEITAGDDGWSAAKVWEGKALINSYIPPVETGGALFGYSTRFFTAVDAESGETLFRSREPGDGFPLIIDDQMVILTKAGTLHLGPATRDGWTETGSLALFDGHSWTAPAYADGSLYLRSFDQLARVDLVRGDAASTDGDREMPARIAEIAAAADPMAAADRLVAAEAPPWIDGDRVTFIWRGEAEDVGIGGDMLGVRAEAAMERLPGTDVWWYSAAVPEAQRLNYAFLVDYGPAIPDPHHPRRLESTLYGPDMNIARPERAEMSWLALPGWQEPEHYREPEDGHPRGTIHELELTFQPPAPEEEAEAPEPVPVAVAVWTPPGYDGNDQRYDVAYVLDAAARTHGGWVHSLDRLVGVRFDPAVVVFVDMPPMPPPLQSAAFLDLVVPRVEAEFRVGSERDARALVGAGGSSVSAFTLAFTRPDFAQRLAALSFHGIEVMLAPLEARLEELDGEEPDFDIYLEWGALDFRAVAEGWDMRDAARRIFEQLEQRGYSVTGGEVPDTTDWASWRNRTDVVLETLFPLK